MATSYTVPIPGGGEYHVNANSPQAAYENVGLTAPGSGGGGGGGQSLEAAKQAILAGFKESSGFSREELAEKKRQFDEQMALAEREWQRQGLPELQIKQRLAQLEEDKFHETARQFNSTQGLEYLKFASSLGGPADVFQSADFYRGAQQRGDLPVFLQALEKNTQLPAFQGAGTVPQEAQTAAGIASRLTGGGATTPGGYNPDQALASIGSIFQRGATGLSGNALEQLNPSEIGILQSGAKKLGYSWDDWIKSYGASRVGQSASTAA